MSSSFAQQGEIPQIFSAKAKAIAKIEGIGGRVEYESGKSGQNVVGVDLSHTMATNTDLAILKYLPTTKYIDISGTKINDAGLNYLKELSNLDKVNIANTEISEASVSEFAKICPRVGVSRKPRSLKYFKDGVFGQTHHEFFADLYSEYLYSMSEPSLWELSQKDRKAVAYRFTWIPSIDRPLSVRILPSGNGAVVYAVQLDGRNRYTGGKPTFKRSMKLTREQWEEFERKLNEAKIWSIPSDLVKEGVADGSAFVLESIKDGKYHVINANTNFKPSDTYRRYKSVCEEILKFSDLDVSKYWDKF